MNKPILKASGLTKKFGEVQALKEVNLELKKGKVTVFLGENGAGKTTTLKIILGFLFPDTGKVEKIEAKLRLGYVPEQPVLFPWLKGREILALTGKIYGLRQVEIDKKISDLVSLLSFDPTQLERRVQTYSPGNQKKMAYLQNLLIDPELLIVDEPFSSLDPIAIKRIRDIFFNFKREGRTLFISSHLISEAEKLADEVIIIKKGKTLLQVDWSEFRRERVYLKIKKETLASKIVFERWPDSRFSGDYLENFVLKNEWKELFVSLEEKNKLAGLEEIEVSQPDLETFFLFWIGNQVLN
ncbi:MAG: ABC transporter ATP-binding protein [Candidatus Aminicenantes bacterium]|nr:ABC transporter ATP-binding protein [Candidatus Aminicenantes bacterium]